MGNLADALRRHGLSSDEFRALYDLQLKGLDLHEQPLDTQLPMFFKCARSLCAIAEIIDLNFERKS